MTDHCSRSAKPSLYQGRRRSGRSEGLCVLAAMALAWGGACGEPNAQPPRRPDDHTPGPPASTTTEASVPPSDPRRAEVEELIHRYFRTWSDQDMAGYGACFCREACIQFIDSQGEISTFALGPFLAGQQEAHRAARHRQTEVPESIDIRFEAQLARAVVYWKLTAGPRTDFGYDHFTLVKQRGQWRIAHLIFYVTKSVGASR